MFPKTLGINTQLIFSTAGLENLLASPGLGQKGHENLGLDFHMVESTRASCTQIKTCKSNLYCVETHVLA